ncbi:hypothetical protein E3N88_29082 [Mikania micrantha]|uniref:Uncharacterized protein n=1 Tax=Mikania micrantha TaxID=192012 RepID=A0A5N6N1X0_9ASTR|nr:hypothetical protein E3N88_29082 [Mikania micrantha]
MASQPRSTSALPTFSAAATNVSLQIPVFTKKPENPGKKTTFVAESVPLRRMTTTAPVVFSNNDILSMFQQVQQQMIDQQRMNPRLLREMESLKAEKNKQVEVTTPIAPKILDLEHKGCPGIIPEILSLCKPASELRQDPKIWGSLGIISLSQEHHFPHPLLVTLTIILRSTLLTLVPHRKQEYLLKWLRKYRNFGI